MKEKNGGECNLSYIDTFFDSLPNDIDGIFVIKSTVPIGTTKNISQKRTDLKIIHNPEFLTARNSVEDFNSADRNIIGGYLIATVTGLVFYQLLGNTPVSLGLAFGISIAFTSPDFQSDNTFSSIDLISAGFTSPTTAIVALFGRKYRE